MLVHLLLSIGATERGCNAGRLADAVDPASVVNTNGVHAIIPICLSAVDDGDFSLSYKIPLFAQFSQALFAESVVHP